MLKTKEKSTTKSIQDWEEMQIGDVLEVKYGKSQKEVEVDESDIPILGTGGIIGWASRPLFNKESVLIGRKGTINKPQYMDKPFWTIDTLFYTNINTNKAVPKFIYYLFQTINWYKYNEATGVPSLSASNISSIPFNCPSVKEQQKISEILSTVDSQAEQIDQLIEKIKVLKKGLMQKLFTNGIGHTEFKKTDVGEIPHEWKITTLNDVLEVMTDYVANGSFKSLADNVNVFDENGYAYYVRLFDLRLGLGHSEQKYVDKKSYDFLKKSSLFGNEVLIANIGANVGEVFMMPLVDKPATIAPNMIVMKGNSSIDNSFLYYYLSSEIGQKGILQQVSGSGQPKLNKTELKKVKCILPSLNEQIQIKNVLNAVDNNIESLILKKNKIEQFKKGLMQKLLTGKIRVPL